MQHNATDNICICVPCSKGSKYCFIGANVPFKSRVFGHFHTGEREGLLKKCIKTFLLRPVNGSWFGVVVVTSIEEVKGLDFEAVID